MSPSLPGFEIEKLSVAQRLDLIGLLWDSIPDTLDVLPVPQSHKEELERRLAGADADPGAGIPWEVVKSRLRADT